MNVIRKALTTLGGVFLVALLIIAVAPKAARGVAASLVQVTNTSTNPMPTVSADANFPYEARICVGECGGIAGNSFSVPSATTTGVPVKRLVIEEFNAICPPGSPGVVGLSLPPSADNGTAGFFMAYQFLLTASGSGESYGNAIVRIYADPLSTVTLTGSAATGVCIATVTGYLETK